MSWLTSEESITRYNESLVRAARDDEHFKQFRREAGVREIVEGVPDVVGRGYHAKLMNLVGADGLSHLWERAVKNDAVGEPALVELPPHGHAASTTMRYLWNVLDMRRHGVRLDEGAHIVEIGGGYGGLCRMVCEFHDPNSYTIVDLPEALELAERYLAHFGIRPNLVSCYEYQWHDDPVTTLISNYALTELTRDVQEGYVNKFARRAPTGYITYNSQPRNAGQQYSLDELKSFVPGNAVIEDENVKKSECKVLVWTP